jgi:hypothetical protein
MKPPLDTQQRLAPEPYLPFLLLTLTTAAFAATAVILNKRQAHTTVLPHYHMYRHGDMDREQG